MDYSKHKDYYRTAYRNGADIWTHLPIKIESVRKLTSKLPPGGTILDLGSGRGFIARHLAEMGFKVIGVDFEGEIVKKVNAEVKNWELEGKLKFIEADVFNVPFTDASFDGACAFGLMENMHKEDWSKYADEIRRVLKPKGFYLDMSFSRKAKNFLGFSPTNSKDGELEKNDVHYHFFEEKEMKNIFDKKMELISQNVEFLKQPTELALLESLFQKNK